MHLQADSSRCSGCRACLLACALQMFGVNNPKRAALAVIPHFPAPGHYEVRTCTQCGVCADICPTGVIRRDDRGVYTIARAGCTDCGLCARVCPEQVIFRYPEPPVPIKCDACGECVAFCGMGALMMIHGETT